MNMLLGIKGKLIYPPSLSPILSRGGWEGEAKYAPPPLTPTPAGEATAFPIYPNLKVKQGKHDTVLAKNHSKVTQNKKSITALTTQ
jgi:hypothetical protein